MKQWVECSLFANVTSSQLIVIAWPRQMACVCVCVCVCEKERKLRKKYIHSNMDSLIL